MFAPSLRAALIVSALVTSSGNVDELVFRPEAERVLVKTFALNVEGEDAMEFSHTQGEGSQSSTLVLTQVLVVTDRILEVEDGQVLKLERTYDTVERESETTMDIGEMGSHEGSESGASDVEGATVLFEWDPEGEEWSASSDDLDDDALLELRYDLDFLDLLPDDEVAEGDEWTIDADTWSDLRNVWEGIPWESTRTIDGETQGTVTEEADGEKPDETRTGEIVARYAGTRDEDGITVAVIELEGTIEVERVAETNEDSDQINMSSYTEVFLTRSVSGELLWLLDEGRLYSVALETDVESSTSHESSGSFGDQEFESTAEGEGSQTIAFTVVFEPADEDE